MPSMKAGRLQSSPATRQIAQSAEPVKARGYKRLGDVLAGIPFGQSGSTNDPRVIRIGR
jgi:hypothetical protein